MFAISELEEKLGSILSNQDAMSQIMALARSLGGGTKNAEASPPPHTATEHSPAKTGELPSSLPGELDPRIWEIATRFLSSYRSDEDDRAALLNALRPFVRAERYARLDQAIRLSRMTRAVRIALDAFKDGGDHHV